MSKHKEKDLWKITFNNGVHPYDKKSYHYSGEFMDACQWADDVQVGLIFVSDNAMLDIESIEYIGKLIFE